MPPFEWEQCGPYSTLKHAIYNDVWIVLKPENSDRLFWVTRYDWLDDFVESVAGMLNTTSTTHSCKCMGGLIGSRKFVDVPPNKRYRPFMWIDENLERFNV